MTDSYTPPKVWQPKEQEGRFGAINRPTAGARHEQALPRGDKPLQLYSLNTPNGIKINIMLLELAALNIADAAFDAYRIDILALDQFGSEFTALNPNSKIPAMIDQSGDKPVELFESGSILLDLAEKFGHFLPKDVGQARAEVLNWLMWQMGSAPYLGGGFGHFYHYAPVHIEYAIDRFTMETKRQFDLIDKQLATREYLCECGYSIADMAIWPWYARVAMGDAYGDAHEFLNVAEYPNLLRWAKQLAERETIKAAVTLELQPIK